MNSIGNFQTLDSEKLLVSTEKRHCSTSVAILFDVTFRPIAEVQFRPTLSMFLSTQYPL